MSSAKSRSDALRQGFLAARDGREAELHRQLATLRGGALLQVASNVPGPDKLRPGLGPLLQETLALLEEELGLTVLHSGHDALGGYHLGQVPHAPEQAKRVAVALEGRGPAGRVLDLDVYGPDGRQVDRASLGLPPRTCLLCAEPARECIRLQRHSGAELLAGTDALIQDFQVPGHRLDPRRLAQALHQGALAELDLTPKPGLVDRHDSGSHADLTHAAMLQSANLLPRYYADLLRCCEQARPWADCNRAGQDAEQRMVALIQSNGHKGYIFLSGLVLMAAWRSRGRADRLRSAVTQLAGEFFGAYPVRDSHGERLRARLGLGGIRREALAGLPAVFEHGWPRYREALAAGWEPERAGYYLMAVLMGQVEDSTAVQRAGLDGLVRLRTDGARLAQLLEQGRSARAFLEELNADYRRLNLTMGGVADCMALTFALEIG
jgi:triphosphoribosyl-dephospho-CoA synthase